MVVYAHAYYKNLNTKDTAVENNSKAKSICLSSVSKLVTPTQKKDLKWDSTPGVVKIAVKELPRDKELGLDMISTEFLQDCWEEIGSDIVEFAEEVLSQGKLPIKLNTSNIALIPKTRDLSIITNYRPIFLLNIVYKFIAKS